MQSILFTELGYAEYTVHWVSVRRVYCDPLQFPTGSATTDTAPNWCPSNVHLCSRLHRCSSLRRSDRIKSLWPKKWHVTHNCEQIWEKGQLRSNAKFWHYSSYHHFKAVRVSDFILGLWAHQAFCFTNPMFKAVDSLLSEVAAVKLEV